MAKSLNEYMAHFNSFLTKQEAVRRRVVHEASRDFYESLGSMCAALSSPSFTHLRGLISRKSYSLLGRMDTALEEPKPGGGISVAKTNKGKSSGGGAQPLAARPRIDGAAQAYSFVTGLEQDGTPAGACYFEWRELQCTRKNCAYGHKLFSQNGLRTQGPPAPTSMQQPQQYQQQQAQQQQPPPPQQQQQQ